MLPVKVMPPEAVVWITKLNESELSQSNVAQVRTYQPSDVVAKPLTWLVESFQQRVKPWLEVTFGLTIMNDKRERNHRFCEEALETVQAGGMTRSEMHQLVDYVCDRPVGELKQEVGGAMMTLAALSLAHGIDMHDAAETELARVWTMVAVIRAKQAAKPKHSPLPVSIPFREAVEAMVIMLEENEWAEHAAATTGKGDPLAQRLEDQLTRLHNDSASLETIDLKAEAGLCSMTHGGARAFLQDIREIVAEQRTENV